MGRRASIVFQAAILPLPWWARRSLLRRVLGFRIADTAQIGRSIIEARSVELGERARIGHLNLIRGLSRLTMKGETHIGNLNWVSAFPIENKTEFAAAPDRDPSLILDYGGVITNRHLIDCTDLVLVGTRSIIAGWGSQVLTHSVNLGTSRQGCAPIRIGRHCWVATRVVLLPGAALADCNVLGAGSVLTKKITDTYKLVSGVPARVVRDFDRSAAFFSLEEGPPTA